MNKILETTSLIICFGFAVTVPFSMAASLITMLGMGGLILVKILANKDALRKILHPQKDLIWMLIPLVYFISLSYSRNFHRGWEQWQILLPLIVLPIFFELFSFQSMRIKPGTVYVIACVISILLHFIPYTIWPAQLVKSLGPTSLFFTPVQNSWIWWSAIMTLILKTDKVKADQLFMMILLSAMMYLGQVGLLLLVYIMYVIKEWKQDRDELSEMLTRVMIFLPLFFISGWIFFPAFQNSVLNIGYALLSLYTKEEVVGPVKWFITDATCTIQQWWLHPLSGVGIGDYIDAMWNQYQSIKLDLPEAPYQQIGHMLLSGGMMFLIVFFLIWNAYRSSDRYTKSLVAILLVTMIFFAPLNSQISAFVFLLPLFFTTMNTSHD
ncbi:MAG: hypothetical protein ABI761_06920 [Saprospiraceae bacterium]